MFYRIGENTTVNKYRKWPALVLEIYKLTTATNIVPDDTKGGARTRDPWHGSPSSKPLDQIVQKHDLKPVIISILLAAEQWNHI